MALGGLWNAWEPVQSIPVIAYPPHPGYSSSLKTTPTYHIPQMPTYEDIPGLSTLSADVPIKKVKNLVKKKPGLVAPNNIYMLLPDDDAGDSVNFFKSTDIRLVK